MTLFNLIYVDVNGTNEVSFTNFQFKTKTEFEEDVNSLFLKYGDDIINRRASKSTDPEDWAIYIINKLSELGYKQVNHCNIYVNQYPVLLENDLLFKQRIGEDLFNKALEHNKKIEGAL